MRLTVVPADVASIVSDVPPANGRRLVHSPDASDLIMSAPSLMSADPAVHPTCGPAPDVAISAVTPIATLSSIVALISHTLLINLSASAELAIRWRHDSAVWPFDLDLQLHASTQPYTDGLQTLAPRYFV